MQVYNAAGEKFHQAYAGGAEHAFFYDWQLNAAYNIHYGKAQTTAKQHGPVSPAAP